MSESKYTKKFLDPRWQKLRLEVFQRDNFTCRHCQSKNNQLHAHHTYYESYLQDPWDYELHSIITLCNDCHEVEHQHKKIADKMLMDHINMTGISWCEKPALIAAFSLAPKDLPRDFWKVIGLLFTDIEYYKQTKQIFDSINNKNIDIYKEKIDEFYYLIQEQEG